MSIISINGFSKSPSEYSVSIQDIVEAERDAQGTMHIDLIAKKYKIECKWSYLTQAEMSNLLNSLENNITFSVYFIDPHTGSNKSITCYKGDRKIPIMQVRNGVASYKDFSISLIEI